jgi:RNA polymerase sigma-70 factor, ECF subfamily
MDSGLDDERVVQAWKTHRPYLVDLAFRMLGDIGAAEDVVQDAFSRLIRTMPGEIEDERGWLIVVTSRLCLDQIRSARSRRERPHDSSEIEFVPTHTEPVGAGAPAADPADRVTLDDNVRLALLVVLQRLSAAERVVFVLHDIFGVPFGTVAETVGRPAATCRQLARRARQKIEDGQGGARFDVGAAEHRLVTETPGVTSTSAPATRGPAVSCAARSRWRGTCCASGARRRPWCPTRSAASPRCWGSATVRSPACWCSRCAASRSRACM